MYSLSFFVLPAAISLDLFQPAARRGTSSRVRDRPHAQRTIAQVQMGFSIVCISLLENEVGGVKLSSAEKDAMLHCWRYSPLPMEVLARTHRSSLVPMEGLASTD